MRWNSGKRIGLTVDVEKQLIYDCYCLAQIFATGLEGGIKLILITLHLAFQLLNCRHLQRWLTHFKLFFVYFQFFWNRMLGSWDKLVSNLLEYLPKFSKVPETLCTLNTNTWMSTFSHFSDSCYYLSFLLYDFEYPLTSIIFQLFIACFYIIPCSL